jgi:hypothetical protein
MTKTVNKTLEQVKQDAQNKGMKVVEQSAFPFQHLKGIILKVGDITLYAWEISEGKTRIDRA